MSEFLVTVHGTKLPVYLIETVEVAFSLLLINHSRFLKQIISHVATNGIPLKVEVDVHVLAEPRRIVISVGLCIAERLQYRVRLDQDVLHPEIAPSSSFYRARFRAHCEKIEKKKKKENT